MGQAQTHLESKVFDDSAPPWDLESITANTDLSEETVNACWRMWVQHPLVQKGQLKEQAFYKLLNFAEDGTAEAEEQSAEKRQATRLFELLDREDDDRLEFPDLMMFLFTMEPEMTQEQKLRRSFKLCDQNQSGKISKEEMVEVLDKLEVLDMEHDDKGKVIIPDNVENLFSLMDFAHDKKISEDEFLKATMHYRKLGQMMTINLMESRRKEMQHQIKDFVAKEKEEAEEEERKRKQRKDSRRRIWRTGSKASKDDDGANVEKTEETKPKEEDQEEVNSEEVSKPEEPKPQEEKAAKTEEAKTD